MNFPVISNYNAELVKKVKVAVQGTMSNMRFLSTVGQVAPRRTHLFNHPGQETPRRTNLTGGSAMVLGKFSVPRRPTNLD